MRFSVLPPSYSFVAMVMSRSRDCFLSSITVIFTTASEPSSFRVTVTFSMISRADGGVCPSAWAGAPPADSRASATNANRCFDFDFDFDCDIWGILSSVSNPQLGVAGAQIGVDQAEQRVGRSVENLAAHVDGHRVGHPPADA